MEKLSLRDKLAVALFFVGAGLDTGLTLYLVNQSSFREGNPIVAEALNHVGVFGIVGIKAGVAVLGLAMLYKLVSPDDFRKAIRTGLFICGGVWLVAGLWNAALFFFA